MGLKLLLSSIWLPSWLLKNELDRIAVETTEALHYLLKKMASAQLVEVSKKIKSLTGSIEERRATMAYNHCILVDALAAGIGYNEAIEVAREELFKVGIRLGEEARIRLGVGESFSDVVLAARVIYKILGITFTVNSDRKDEITITRCALSKQYSEFACIVLSAVDEGVVRGLNPKVSMRFERRMTSGFPTCLACVNIRDGGL